MDDIKKWDKFQGTIREVRGFGAFVDIGAELDGVVPYYNIAGEEVSPETIHGYLQQGQLIEAWATGIAFIWDGFGHPLLSMDESVLRKPDLAEKLSGKYIEEEEKEDSFQARAKSSDQNLEDAEKISPFLDVPSETWFTGKVLSVDAGAAQAVLALPFAKDEGKQVSSGSESGILRLEDGVDLQSLTVQGLKARLAKLGLVPAKMGRANLIRQLAEAEKCRSSLKPEDLSIGQELQVRIENEDLAGMIVLTTES